MLKILLREHMGSLNHIQIAKSFPAFPKLRILRAIFLIFFCLSLILSSLVVSVLTLDYNFRYNFLNLFCVHKLLPYIDCKVFEKRSISRNSKDFQM